MQVAHQVNAHLNAEVERMTAAVEALQAERAAFERHIKDLAAKLAAARAALPEAQAAAQAEADAEAAEEAEAAAAGEGALVSDRFAADLPSSRDLASGTSSDGGGEPKSAEEKGSDLQPWLQDGAWQRLQAAGRRQSWLVGPEEVILGEVIGKGTFGEAACPLVGCSATLMRCRPPGNRGAYCWECMLGAARMPAPAASAHACACCDPAIPCCPPLGPGRRGAPCYLAGRLRGGQAGAASVPGAGHHVCAGGGGAGPAAAPARHAAVCGLRGAAPRLLAHLRAAQVGGVSYCWHLRCLQAWCTLLSAVARQALRGSARQLLRRPNKLLQQAGCHHPAFRHYPPYCNTHSCIVLLNPPQRRHAGHLAVWRADGAARASALPHRSAEDGAGCGARHAGAPASAKRLARGIAEAGTPEG